MLVFVKKAFRQFFEVILWANLVLCAISGIVIGSAMGRTANLWTGEGGGGHPILGLFIGIVLGLLINIVLGGIIATLLNIDKNIESVESCCQKMKADIEDVKQQAPNGAVVK